MICEIGQYTPVRKTAINAVMTDLDIKRRLQLAGRTQEQMAAALGLSNHSVSRLVTGKRTLKAAEADRIDEWLAETMDVTITKTAGRIPLFGYAQASAGDRVAFTSDRALDWIEPPPFGTISGPMAAIRIAGDSMEPRLFAGEEVIIALNLAPARGKDCIVEFTDGSATVKSYERSRDGVIFCRQWSPEQEVRYAADEVKALHAVIWRR